MILRLLLLAALLTGSTFASDDYAKSVETWRAERVTRLLSPNGWLTLIGRHRCSPGRIPSARPRTNSIKLAAGPPYLGTVTLAEGKVTFAPSPSAIVLVDGQPAQTGELVYRGEKPSTVTFGTVNFYVMQRGENLYLRVKDSAAADRANFLGLEYFPIDPAWRIEAQWVPFDPPKQVKITNMIGVTEPAPVPGKAVFTYQGHTVELLPIDEGGDDLFFVLTDLTAGEETYEALAFSLRAAPRAHCRQNRARFQPDAESAVRVHDVRHLPAPAEGKPDAFRVPAGEKKYRGHHD